MAASAATDVQIDVSGPGPGKAPRTRAPVFKQPLRVTVRLRKFR
jgi:hypothetical protein